MTTICPYCGLHARDVDFLFHAQLRYVKHYCATLSAGIQAEEQLAIEIDMDAVADATAAAQEDRPAFYVSDESQQRKFTCKACEEYNDIIGRFGYCSRCGTRSDLAYVEDTALPELSGRC